jgi:hypothetical protein
MRLPLTTSLSSLLSPFSCCFGFYGRHWYPSCLFDGVVACAAITTNTAVVDNRNTRFYRRHAWCCYFIRFISVLLKSCNKYFIASSHVILQLYYSEDNIKENQNQL